MEIIKLKPAVKDLIWGGTKLKEYGKDGDRIAETWELSYHKDGACTTESGIPLSEVATREDLGENAQSFDFFPMLIKFIDAKDNLSIQVHPSDAYSVKNEGQLGKTEMWYIIDAEEGAGLYMGFKKTVTPEKFAKAIENNTVTDLLNFIPVKPGEHYFIKSGTVHAIGKGVTLCEVQQNSNVTYRVYDYGRLGVDGKPRQLHVEKAKAVSNLAVAKPISPSVDMGGGMRMISTCKYFTVYEWKVSGENLLPCDEFSFTAVCCISGSGYIGGVSVNKGDTVFIPAGLEDTYIEGDMTLIVSSLQVLAAVYEKKKNGYKVMLSNDRDGLFYNKTVKAESGVEAVKKAAEKFGCDIDDFKVLMGVNY